MMVAPIGIINADPPRQAYQDAFNVASMIVEGHNRDAALFYGAGAVREDWKEACENANRGLSEEIDGDPSRNFKSMVTRMVGSLKEAHENACSDA